MTEQTNKTIGVKDVVTDEMIERALARGFKGAVEDAHEFVEHVHTLWDRISDLYNEYILSLMYFGFKVSLKITDKDDDIVMESSLDTGKKEED